MGESGKRILVIDDSAPYLDFMRTLLSSEGYQVDTASTSAAGEQHLDSARPDLIITDALLPGMPPFGILDLLAQRKDAQDVPILICTAAAHETRAQAARFKQEGISVLLKPFDIEVLLDRVAQLCAGTG